MAKKILPFKTMLDPVEEISSNPGSKIEEVWAMRLDENGNEEFYIKGTTNVYEKIQMFKDDCDLELILERCAQTGDLSTLNQKQPFFVDMEDYPTDIFEAHRKIKQAEEAFNELPIDIKAKYDMNFDKFLADFGSENWIKNMGLKEEAKEEIKETKGAEETE